MLASFFENSKLDRATEINVAAGNNLKIKYLGFDLRNLHVVFE